MYYCVYYFLILGSFLNLPDFLVTLNKKLTLFSKHLKIHVWKFFSDGSIISHSLGVKFGCLPTEFLLG